MAESVEKNDDPGVRRAASASNGDASNLVIAGSDERKRSNSILPRMPSPSLNTPGSPKIECQALAQKLAGQAVTKWKPEQWGLLTALSDKARKRIQGCHIILHSADHMLGRTVTEIGCLFDSPAVSGRHCTITRRLIHADGRAMTSSSSDRPAAGGAGVYGVFVKDSSSNGTFVNREKLKRSGAEVRLVHGDILSLVSLPEHDTAFAFVFREVVDEPVRQLTKRKSSPSDHEIEASAIEGKRMRVTGNGISDGPVSLDDVRRLQKSNEDLRQQLETHVLEIEKMRGEFRAAEALHVVELKDLRASVTEMYVQQLEDVRLELVNKTKELEESTALCVQLQTTLEDLNHRLAAAAQSRADAEEAIQSHKDSIAELKKRLEEEFGQRQKERAEWEANLEAAVERTRLEASDELKRHSEASARLQKEQQDIIVDLQEADKVNRCLADGLRVKLEVERQAVINAEEKGRRLTLQLQEERLSTENACKRAAELDEELRKLNKELESEKAAKESAGAKVAFLELAVETAIRDLTLEKQRLQGARERIVLRETQLRAFYSTAAQVEALQQKQQQQLKLMLRTLEDGDGDGDYSQSKEPKPEAQKEAAGNQDKLIDRNGIDLTLNLTTSSTDDDLQAIPSVGEKVLLCVHTGNADGNGIEVLIKEEEGSDEKEECAEPDWMDGDTQQEGDCFATAKAPGSDETIRVPNSLGDEDEYETKVMNVSDTQMLELGVATQIATDTFQETRESRQAENQGVGGGYEGVTMEVDYGFRVPDGVESVGNGVTAENIGLGPLDAPDTLEVHSPTLNMGIGNTTAHQDRNQATRLERRNNASTICTADLVSSEVAGSWALSTPPSEHAENEVGSSQNLENKVSDGIQKTWLKKMEHENTLCTDDLLTSEVAGSWAVSTPGSQHGDNDSISSDERKDADKDNFQKGSGGGGKHPQVSRSRPIPHHILLEEVMHLSDHVNSQSSLSPATTTNPIRNEREALGEMLDIVEPGFGSLHGLSRVTKTQSDIDDSTTEEEDNDENEEHNGSSDGSQPSSHTPLRHIIL